MLVYVAKFSLNQKESQFCTFILADALRQTNSKDREIEGHVKHYLKDSRKRHHSKIMK